MKPDPFEHDRRLCRDHLAAGRLWEVIDHMIRRGPAFEALRDTGGRLRCWFDIQGTVAFLRSVVEADGGEAGDRYAALRAIRRGSRPLLIASAEWLVANDAAAQALPLIDEALAQRPDDLYVQDLYERAHLQSSGGISRGGMVAPEALEGKFCRRPFEQFEMTDTGAVFVCCATQLPVSIGNGYSQSVEEIWNGPAARELRRSIADGSFRYCSRMHCPLMLEGRLPPRHRMPEAYRNGEALPTPPSTVILNHDRSCNLSCPSCRKEVYAARGDQADRLLAIEDGIVALVNNARYAEVTNSGDPFASRHFRAVLSRIDPVDRAGFTLQIFTNGQLFTDREWERIAHLHDLRLQVQISIDAATAGTYAQVRRGGDFDRLLANLAFIAGLRRQDRIAKFLLCFVVQACNWREMADFVDLAERHAVDHVHFQRLRNWGTFAVEDYRDADVCNPAHPEYAAFQAFLRQPVFARPIVHLGTVPVTA